MQKPHYSKRLSKVNENSEEKQSAAQKIHLFFLAFSSGVSFLIDFLKLGNGIMSIDLSCSQRRVPKHLLDGIQLCTTVKQPGRHGVSQDVRRLAPCKSCSLTKLRLHHPVHIDRIKLTTGVRDQ